MFEEPAYPVDRSDCPVQFEHKIPLIDESAPPLKRRLYPLCWGSIYSYTWRAAGGNVCRWVYSNGGQGSWQGAVSAWMLAWECAGVHRVIGGAWVAGWEVGVGTGSCREGT